MIFGPCFSLVSASRSRRKRRSERLSASVDVRRFAMVVVIVINSDEEVVDQVVLTDQYELDSFTAPVGCTWEILCRQGE